MVGRSTASKEFVTHYTLETPKGIIGKSANPDQMLQNAVSDEGVHYLQIV